VKPVIYIFGAGRVGTALYHLFKFKFTTVLTHSRPCAAYHFSKGQIGSNDIVFICTPSKAIGPISEDLATTNALIVHCSGADEIELIKADRKGIFYPLQTFSGQPVDFNKIPIFIQGQEIELLQDICTTLNLNSFKTSNEERARLHLAAVFANNFTNAILFASQKVLGDLPMIHLLPLIEETLKGDKLTNIAASQTGPAMRNDLKTIQKHLNALENTPDEKAVYELLTNYIQQNIKDKD
jgi:predicted short-subunit dehydrogenase-like oxidoreductase (DUF2520 family)